MKIFISWSGERSRLIAETLRDWLKDVIQAVEPWMSSEDIPKGSQWVRELTDKLDQTNFGIVCLTPENLEAQWLMFEAGAVSKTVAESHVSPYLFDLKPTDVSGPLSNYQHTLATKEDTEKLIKSINLALAENSLSESTLKRAFERCWPDLKKKLDSVPDPTEDTSPHRSERELLEEILGIVRNRDYFSPKLNVSRDTFLDIDRNVMVRKLTPKEERVLQLRSIDVSTKVIATKLGISTPEIAQIQLELLDKLGASTLNEAIKLARKYEFNV